MKWIQPLPRLPRPTGRDVLLAGLATVLDLALSSSIASLQVPAAQALALLGFVALVWRRSAPVVVLGVLIASFAISGLLPEFRPSFGVWLALYTVAALRGPAASAVALAVTLGVTVPMVVVQEQAENPTQTTAAITVYGIALYSFATGVAWGIGRWVQRSNRRVRALDERSRKEAAEAVAAERRRIALELHDIVSNSVSVMHMQAAGAQAVLDADPARARDALQRIEKVGKESMGELRRMLGVLSSSGVVDLAQSTSQQRGLSDLPGMIEDMRHSGLVVDLAVSGTPAPLAPSIDLSAYRIVQEALTNCLKHAGRGAAVAVRLDWSRENLAVEVVDDGGGGNGTSGLSTAHGLPGLQERAKAVGGTFQAGPADGGGFRVAATLPLEPPDQVVRTARTSGGDGDG